MSVGLVMTVKNEAALLRANLLYHRHLGVERCFVFDDGSSDGTPDTVSDLGFVELRSTVDAAAFPDRPDLADHIRPNPYQSRRQALNCAAALDLARKAGLDWLVHVDADELLLPDLGRANRGDLVAHLDGVESSIESVVFVVIEAIQLGLADAEAFGATLFRRHGVRFERPAFDPAVNETWPVEHYGHAQGKAAVRVDVDSRPASPHRFVRRDGSPLVERTAGWVGHYYGYNARDFWDKFKATSLQGNRYPLGDPVQRRVRVWHAMAHDPRFSDADLDAYYERWIRFKDAEIARLRRSRRFGILKVEPALVEVTAAREAMLGIGVLTSAGGAM